jgi:rhodanese-related sulfurtransferase
MLILTAFRRPEVWMDRRWLAALAAFAATQLACAADPGLSCPAAGPAGDAPLAAREAPPEGPFTRPEATVPANKRTARGLYVTATDAYGMVVEDPARILFIDVRTRGELQFIGMPALADAHVPFLVEAVPLQWDDKTSSFRLVPNPEFVAAVDRRLAAKGLSRDAPVLVICQGGLRAARAVDALTQAGYRTAYAVVDGFEGDPVAEGPQKGQRVVNGWRNAGLPWTAQLDRAKMYGLD